jgi:hypothetical protein
MCGYASDKIRNFWIKTAAWILIYAIISRRKVAGLHFVGCSFGRRSVRIEVVPFSIPTMDPSQVIRIVFQLASPMQ